MEWLPCHPAFRCGQLIVVPLLLAATCFPCAAHGQKPSARASLIVVSDDNYPPYVFREASGRVRGIIPDQWALWERKTGVKVELRAMPWSEAQQTMREGRADIIDTIFFTEERAKLFDFTPAYARIEVPVYAHKTLGGMGDLSSLKGFTIGVKTGDAVIDFLTLRGIRDLKEYPSYEAIILAAKSQEIKVFSVDQPAAVYFLYKHSIQNEFRQSFVLYTGEFHRAVAKNHPDLLHLVQDGFERISRREYRAIDRKWMGSPFLLREFLRQWRPWIISGVAAILALVMGNVLLGRRVHARTAELRTAVADLRQGLAARRESENALRASREYLATVFDSINDALFVHDAQTGTVIDVNRRVCEMYGFSSREEALSVDLESLCAATPPYALADGKEWMRKAFTEGPQSFEWHARHHDGHLFWVETNIRKVKIGTDDRLIVTVRDITDRKRAETERAALQEQLIHAQKLESVGRLAGGVAHDFNNMLQAILSYTEMAIEQVPPDQPLHNDLLEIQKAAQSSSHLTRQLQTFARKQLVAPTALNINSAIDAMSGMLRRLIGEDIHFEWKPGRNIGAVMMDHGQLDQIVVNLCVNARDAIGKKPGHIAIETRNVEITPAEADQFADITSGAYVLLSIRDDGSGMSPETRERIFEPFFTTKPLGHGTGLGLSIVYGIVKQNRGSIRVGSEPGKGTIFQIHLPHYASEQPAHVPPADAGPPTPAASRTILLVDDEETILRITERILDNLGYRVFATSSPMEALRLFDQHMNEIDLLIADVIMPDIRGPEMARLMLKQRPKLKHLFISGHAADLLAGQERSRNHSNYIQKPFSRETLAQKVREALAQP
jgi:two-component system cell cycle sensor histidine kinase/response regulator CckA